MELNFYSLSVLYLVYSFLGWVGETVVATIKGRRFANRGVASGPFCFIYGFTAVLLAISFADRPSPLLLFLGCAIDATVVEWLTAKLLERVDRRRWWDYSGKRFNVDGYICLQYSLLWGALGTATVLWGNGLLFKLYGLLPQWLVRPLLWVSITISLLDQLGAFLAVSRYAREHPHLEQLNAELEKHSDQLRTRLSSWVEPLFCRVTAGVWMSRSSLVWGPFSVVWGLALALSTVLLRNCENKSDSAIFAFGVFMGGAYEYVCSAVGELLFGVIFWDYSGFKFNIAGRVNLLYCFFWGIAAVVWLRLGYPLVAKGMDLVRRHVKPWMTILLAIFMAVNMSLSGLALARYNSRTDGITPRNQLEVFLDEHFDNARMERVYPNAKKT